MKNLSKVKIKRFLLGKNVTDGLIFKAVIYLLLTCIGFIYLYPMLYMFSSSLKSPQDIVNPMIKWIPSSLYFGNYERAFKVLQYVPTLLKYLLITLLPATIQTAVTAVIGYGFAKFDFKFKKVLLVLVLLTFVIPVQVYMIPRFVMFDKLNLLNPLAVILPALFGQGLNSAIFILIFYQFFRMIPKSLNEAAEIDGAGPYYIFFKIAIPLAIPAFITCFLFGLVWYWNETYISGLFMQKYPNLQMNLAYFVSNYENMYPSEQLMKLNEGIRLAATLLIILPMLIVYFTMQRWFVEGVEKSGITGE
jgi:multiple sugar transport system permease protein